MNTYIRLLNTVLILVLAGILCSAFIYQIVLNEEPCPLCMLQRLGLMGIAIGALLNLRFGIKPLHYGISIFSALFSSSVSLRQISLHICPGFPTFGTPVFGLGLYTWAFLAAVCSIFVVALLLFLYGENGKKEHKTVEMSGFEKFAFGILFVITTINIFSTLSECGLSACTG